MDSCCMGGVDIIWFVLSEALHTISPTIIRSFHHWGKKQLEGW